MVKIWIGNGNKSKKVSRTMTNAKRKTAWAARRRMGAGEGIL